MRWPLSFMNTADEWHSFVVGFFDSMCPLPRSVRPRLATERMIWNEYWYYTFGRGLGAVALVLIMLGLSKLGVWMF